MVFARRTILAAAGANALVIGAAGARRFAFAQQVVPGAEPWSARADAFPDPRIRALAFAILAPNNFNLQPWVAELVGDDRLILGADLHRRSPVWRTNG